MRFLQLIEHLAILARLRVIRAEHLLHLLHGLLHEGLVRIQAKRAVAAQLQPRARAPIVQQLQLCTTRYEDMVLDWVGP